MIGINFNILSHSALQRPRGSWNWKQLDSTWACPGRRWTGVCSGYRLGWWDFENKRRISVSGPVLYTVGLKSLYSFFNTHIQTTEVKPILFWTRKVYFDFFYLLLSSLTLILDWFCTLAYDNLKKTSKVEYLEWSQLLSCMHWFLGNSFLALNSVLRKKSTLCWNQLKFKQIYQVFLNLNTKNII